MTQRPIFEVDRSVFIADDDPAIRESLVSLLRSVGLKLTALASVPEFLGCPRPDGATKYYIARQSLIASKLYVSIIYQCCDKPKTPNNSLSSVHTRSTRQPCCPASSVKSATLYLRELSVWIVSPAENSKVRPNTVTI
jgi:hypothetical protein